MACSQACSDAQQRSVKISGFTTPSTGQGSVDQVKAALKKGPLVTTLNVYADFMTYADGVYKHVGGEPLGGHAVSIVGYDDTQRAWLIRNSWGPEWGENGFGWVSWDDESGVGSETWGFELAKADKYLSVVSPADLEYASGQYKLVAQAKGVKTSDVQFRLINAENRTMDTLACSSVADESCSAMLDTSRLKEGRYEIYSTNADGSVKSQIREFYVINSEPKMSLSFTAASGTDLTITLDGRPEFVVKATYSPVPIQHMEFRAIYLDGPKKGQIASIKSNDYVLPQMQMGWRTMTVPDGRYTILFYGETTYKGKKYTVESNSMDVTVKTTPSS